MSFSFLHQYFHIIRGKTKLLEKVFKFYISCQASLIIFMATVMLSTSGPQIGELQHLQADVFHLRIFNTHLICHRAKKLECSISYLKRHSKKSKGSVFIQALPYLCLPQHLPAHRQGPGFLHLYTPGGEYSPSKLDPVRENKFSQHNLTSFYCQQTKQLCIPPLCHQGAWSFS